METDSKTPVAIAKALTETIAVVRTKASTLRLTIFGIVLIMYRSELWKTNSSQSLCPAIGIPVAGTPSI
ncbi:hypothetical protein KAQ80_03155 [Candidatus Bipolaricaulota bacterium]|nr:hypothetical protein [Candidatus Bipolaricaulota bacterium]